MTNFQKTANWLQACGKSPGDISVQTGCVLEEVAEFLSCLTSEDFITTGSVRSAIASLDVLSRILKTGHAKVEISTEDRVDALDALCDIEVTINGVAYLSCFDKDTADQRVLIANEAKLIDGKPVILPGGKIGKPAGWYPADLSDCV